MPRCRRDSAKTWFAKEFQADLLGFGKSLAYPTESPTAASYWETLQNAINPIFRLLNGKIICPEEDKAFIRLIVALEKAENPKLNKEDSKKIKKQNDNVIEALKKDFVKIKDLVLGEDYKQ